MVIPSSKLHNSQCAKRSLARKTCSVCVFEQSDQGFCCALRKQSILWNVSLIEDSDQTYITRTRLFKFIENFTSKNWKFSDKKKKL